MATELSVKDVREQLQRAAGGGAAGAGETATLLLGRLFHEVFADLVGGDPERNGFRVLFEAGTQDELGHERLRTHVYRRLVGPRLVRHQSHLQETAEQVLTFWGAVQNLVRLLSELGWTLAQRRGKGAFSWQDAAQAITPEAALACELREPGWTDTVRLVGVADALVRVPERPHLCAIELKLGRSLPVVDLGQAALYHLIATRAAPRSGASALALLRFTPVLEETVVTTEQVAEAQARLLEVIAKMAGVLPAVREPPRPPVKAPDVAIKAPVDTGGKPGATTDLHVDMGRRLVRALREYGRSIELIGEPIVGPRFLRFEARLGPGVLFEQVRRLSAEMQIKLGLQQEPIVTRQGGRLMIDVARPDPESVPFSRIVGQLDPVDAVRGSARLPIGVDVTGRLRCADLANPVNAHLLVAGTTGSGKTEWLRMAIAGLLHSNTPETLRLILIDPKYAAFSELRHSPFLWPQHGFWVPGGDVDVVEVLTDLVAEMDRRYTLMSSVGADDLAGYVAKTGQPLARIVCFCDEYFALVSQGRMVRQEIERQLFLLGAKARAAGIHLVLATQQPSREVIKGVLDTNIPCRVGLLTQSRIESNMLLHASGAERLTGKGDLLYKDIGDPVRLQAPYLTPEERAASFGAR